MSLIKKPTEGRRTNKKTAIYCVVGRKHEALAKIHEILKQKSRKYTVHVNVSTFTCTYVSAFLPYCFTLLLGIMYLHKMWALQNAGIATFVLVGVRSKLALK